MSQRWRTPARPEAVCADLIGQSHTCKVLFRPRPHCCRPITGAEAGDHRLGEGGAGASHPGTPGLQESPGLCQNPPSNWGGSSKVHTTCVCVCVWPSLYRCLLLTITMVLSFLHFLRCPDVGSSEQEAHCAITRVLKTLPCLPMCMDPGCWPCPHRACLASCQPIEKFGRGGQHPESEGQVPSLPGAPWTIPEQLPT